MKRLTLLVGMLIAVSLFFVGNAQATLLGLNLGLPDITSNSTGTYSYNATTNLFSSLATPISITFNGSTLIPITSSSYSVGFYVDESGNFTGGIGGSDLIITGDIDVDGDGNPEYSGILVEGEVTDFGYLDTGTSFDLFDYSFNFTSGALWQFYAAYNNLGADAMSSETSTFAGIFTSNFGGGKTKHDTAPLIPEPTSMLLLGTGILGLFGLKRKKA